MQNTRVVGGVGAAVIAMINYTGRDAQYRLFEKGGIIGTMIAMTTMTTCCSLLRCEMGHTAA
jgi:hypothetical protein